MTLWSSSWRLREQLISIHCTIADTQRVLPDDVVTLCTYRWVVIGSLEGQADDKKKERKKKERKKVDPLTGIESGVCTELCRLSCLNFYQFVSSFELPREVLRMQGLMSFAEIPELSKVFSCRASWVSTTECVTFGRGRSLGPLCHTYTTNFVPESASGVHGGPLKQWRRTDHSAKVIVFRGNKTRLGCSWLGETGSECCLVGWVKKTTTNKQ